MKAAKRRKPPEFRLVRMEVPSDFSTRTQELLKEYNAAVGAKDKQNLEAKIICWLLYPALRFCTAAGVEAQIEMDPNCAHITRLVPPRHNRTSTSKRRRSPVAASLPRRPRQ